MTPAIGLLLAIIGVSVALFWFERVPADVIALGVMLSLIVTGLLPADHAFAGFGSDIMLMLFGLLVLTATLGRTGVVDLAGRAILRRSGKNPQRLLLIVMLAAAGLSAFISNTAATAFFLPVTLGIAPKARISASKLLMPLAFASILTSSVTLVSTSTNLVVSSLMARDHMPPMGMFELAPVGIPIAIVGLVYMWVLGRRLIPDRSPPVKPEDPFGLRPYLSEALILPDSPLIGRTMDESGLGRDLDLMVLQVIRNERPLRVRATTRLNAGDLLLVEGRKEDVLKIKNTAGIDIKADVTLAMPGLDSEALRLAEAILLPRSPLIGRTLKSMHFRERYGLQVLAINRHAETLRQKLSAVRLQMGDVLLIQGPPENIAALDGQNLRLLGAIEDRLMNGRRAPLAIIIFMGALAVATFNLQPLAIAVLIGTVLAFVTRCITPEEAYREVEWRALILIGSMLALGRAMDETGTAAFLASQITSVLKGTDPVWLLAAFFGLTVILTQPMSNQAAAIVVLPVALHTAHQLSLNPRAFAMTVAVAASCSYMTPLEPSCLMVYGPGRYRFSDFLKVGTLLTILILVVAIMLIPRIWPL